MECNTLIYENVLHSFLYKIKTLGVELVVELLKYC